jgi:hypothetical protein
MHISSFGKGDQGMCMVTSTSLSLVMRLAETHISTYVTLPRDLLIAPLGVAEVNQGEHMTCSCSGGKPPKLEVKTHTHTHLINPSECAVILFTLFQSL